MMEDMTCKDSLPTGKKAKRRSNMLYKLRKKGVICDTKSKTIDYPWDQNPWAVCQVNRLCKEFGFRVQLTIE